MAVSSGTDMPIYIRILGLNRTYWYVIETKPSSHHIDDDEIHCNSETDRVRRLSFPNSYCNIRSSKYTNSLLGNNLVVLNSRIYLLGGDADTVNTQTPHHDKYIGYSHLDMGVPGGLRRWQVGGGSLMDRQDGGAAIGHDGTIYSVGQTQYKFTPNKNGVGYYSEKLPKPEIGCSLSYKSHLLALSKNKFVIYTDRGGGQDGEANVMLSYNLELDEWEKEYLHNNFCGFWSPGMLLYEDRYLFSFGSQDPKETEFLCEEVPGIYVFDMIQRQWLSKPVQGLRTDGTVLPTVHKPSIDWDWGGDTLRLYSPYLFRIGKQGKEEHKLALLWYVPAGANRITVVWSKFILNIDEKNQEPRFYATSVSSGSCELDEMTLGFLNCAAEYNRSRQEED